ncbi:MAG: succinate dehydrogenase / fumarate reductase flavoprotein subunit, partial [Candidatus Azotimanducaceae bacterium]
ENWLCHSIYDPVKKELRKRDVNFAPKTVPKFEPMARTY